MRKEILVLIVAFLVVGSLGLLYVGSFPFSVYRGSSATSPSSSTTSISTASSTSSTCYSVTGESAGAALRVLSDSGSPIAGVQVNGANINACGSFAISPIVTDSDGLITLPGTFGTYSLTVAYQGHAYYVNMPMFPVSLTETTLHVPSGVFAVEVVAYGSRPVLNGPSFASSSGGLQLNITLGNYTVRAGDYLPIRVAIVGPGAWNASDAEVTTVVTNSAGVTVENFTERMPDLYSIPYTDLLQGFTTYTGWNTNNVQVAPGEYTLALTASIHGHLLRAQGVIRVLQ